MPSNSLEQEAMDRVRRMYAGYDRRPPSEDAPRPHREPKPHPEPPHPKPPVMPDPPKKNNGLLDMLMQDKEQSLIMLLLVLMMKDGADMNLLLALLYLLI